MTTISTPTAELLSAVAPTKRALRIEGDRLVQRLDLGGTTHVSSVPAIDGDDLDSVWWRSHLAGDVPTAHPASNRSLRYVELFCGSGGLAVGWRRACDELGINQVSMAAADQDDEALAIYKRHNATRLTSTKSVSMLVDHRTRGQGDDCRFVYQPEMIDPSWTDLAGHVDALLAGPPCQGHSSLNNHTRGSDRRNELYLTVPAIAVALDVPIVVIENVRAVVLDRGRVVQSTIALLRGAGYEITEGVIKSADLGWPQRRERYFLIARRDVAPIPIPELMSALGRPPRDLWWAIGDLEDAEPRGFMDEQPVFSPENERRIRWLFDNEAHDLPYSERPECHREGTTYNAVYGRLYADRPAPTITTGFMTPGRGRYIHPTRPRVLSPREAARIQGFPDTYDFGVAGGNPSKAKLGKWIGDAVPMPLGYLAGLSALGGGWG